MWGVYVHYNSRTVQCAIYMCNFGGIFVQGHMPMMGNVYIPVLLVMLSIAVISYVGYILT